MRHNLGKEEVEALAAAAHGFVGSDLAALVATAARGALRRAVHAGPTKICSEEPMVRMGRWRTLDV